MPELSTADVERYTQGRLAQDGTETARLLAEGLTAARRFCRWHVTPQKADHVLTLDGPGGQLLALPTRRLVTLQTISEDGTDLDVVADLYVSQSGLVRKKTAGCWSRHYGSIVVKLTHGYDDADNFNAAVLSYIDRASLSVTGGRPIAVGPFRYAEDTIGGASMFTEVEKAQLEQYRLESPA